MDITHLIDELAKDVAQSVSRRETLRVLARGLGGLFLASMGLGSIGVQRVLALNETDKTRCRTECRNKCTSTSPDTGTVVTDFTCMRNCVSTCEGAVSNDDVTGDTLDAARNALNSGAKEVNLNPSGSVRYRRESETGSVTYEGISIQGKPILEWRHSPTESHGQRDADMDGFFEWRMTVKRGPSATDEQIEINEYNSTTTKVFRGKSYTRSNNFIHVIRQEQDASGVLKVEDTYDVPISRKAETAADWRMRNASLDGPLHPEYRLVKTCSCDELLIMVKRLLKETVDKGLDCLRKNKATGIEATLTEYYLNGIEIECDSNLPLIAQADWWTTWVGREKKGKIIINPDSFCNLTDAEQKRTLFHELMHFHFGEHDPVLTDAMMEGDRDATDMLGKTDQGETCAQLCFGVPAFTTQCDCARCLGTNVCDPRCAAFRPCNPKLAARCRCPTRRKWYKTPSECEADCPSGLRCFGFTRCEVVDVSCP